MCWKPREEQIPRKGNNKVVHATGRLKRKGEYDG